MGERTLPATDERDPILTPNDGIGHDPDWGYSINYGHYGSREHGVPVWGGVPCGHTATFAVELCGQGAAGRRTAEAIWERRHELVALVAAYPLDNVAGTPTARLSISIQRDGSWVVGEYDFRRFRVVLPPR